jgi:hypothetical protein
MTRKGKKMGRGPLGDEEITGAFVAQPGSMMRMAAGNTGGLVGAGMAVAVDKAHPGTGEASADDPVPTLPRIGQVAYLSVSSHEIVVAAAKVGLTKASVLDEVLVRVPRQRLTDVEWNGDDMKAKLTWSSLKLRFDTGVEWMFEVKKYARKDAGRLVDALRAPAEH